MSQSAQILVGDCCQLLADVPEASVPLLIADPPYNYGQTYVACHDKLPEHTYLQWSQQWLTAAHRVLADDGSLWIFVPDEWVSELDVFCKQQLRMFKRSHIIWFYTFGQAGQTNFSRSHTHILYLTKSKKRFIANPDAIRVPSARQLVYGDSRAKQGGKLPDNTWILTKEEMEKVLTPDMDTWLHSRVCGTFKVRESVSPNQLPVPLLRRIVTFASRPGDLVLDPFCGTGSTGEAALSLGRRFCGLELSDLVAEAAQRRLQPFLD